MAEVKNNKPQVDTYVYKQVKISASKDGKPVELSPEELGDAQKQLKKLLKDFKKGNLTPNFGLDFDKLQKSNQETTKFEQSKNKNRTKIVQKAFIQTGVLAGAAVAAAKIGQEVSKHIPTQLTTSANKLVTQTADKTRTFLSSGVPNTIANAAKETIKKVDKFVPTPAKIAIAIGAAVIAGKTLYKTGRVDGINLLAKTDNQQPIAKHIIRDFKL